MFATSTGLGFQLIKLHSCWLPANRAASLCPRAQGPAALPVPGVCGSGPPSHFLMTGGFSNLPSSSINPRALQSWRFKPPAPFLLSSSLAHSHDQTVPIMKREKKKIAIFFLKKEVSVSVWAPQGGWRMRVSSARTHFPGNRTQACENCVVFSG